MEEVEKLLIAGFIREVFYPELLANVVIFKKSNGKWQMCVDFMTSTTPARKIASLSLELTSSWIPQLVMSC